MQSSAKKKLVMIFPMDLAAHYLRCLEICKRIHDPYEILFADSSRYRSHIEQAGYNVFKVENFDPEEVTYGANNFNFAWMNDKNLYHILDSQIKAIEEHRPDVLLGDTSFTLKIAAELTNTKYVSLLNGYMTKYYSYTREVSRKHSGYKYSSMLPPNVFDQISKAIEQITFIQIHEPYRRIRENLGLKNTKYILDELEGDLNLVCDLPEIFPLRNQPSNYKYVGPIFYSNRGGEDETRSFLDKPHPNILVSMGSTGNWNNIQVLTDKVFNDTNFLVSGSNSEKLEGKNIFKKKFLNHCAVLPQIDLVLCHGGNGTIYQALSNGVPVICIPSNFEQEWNSRRIEKTGYGAIIEDHISPQNLKKIITTWIEKKRLNIFSEVKEKILSYSKRQIKIE
jgi:UDP:flavonoid glycosyltransferase YjiC (YdhE family)